MINLLQTLSIPLQWHYHHVITTWWGILLHLIIIGLIIN